ncbi:16302_t:CDS:1, partial [Funneliformis mosseae]
SLCVVRELVEMLSCQPGKKFGVVTGLLEGIVIPCAIEDVLTDRANLCSD